MRLHSTQSASDSVLTLCELRRRRLEVAEDAHVGPVFSLLDDGKRAALASLDDAIGRLEAELGGA